MKNPMVAVYDNLVGQYEIPHAVVHTAHAMRWWEERVKDPSSKYGKNPEDFKLVQIGSIDLVDGSFESLKPVKTLMDGQGNANPV